MAALSHGDAVSNEALAIQKLLRGAGYDSDIFAEQAEPRMSSLARPLEAYAEVSSEDTVCLFHFGIGGAAGPMIYHAKDVLVLLYHNVTPAHFFLGFNNHLTGLCYHGRRELPIYASRTALALTPSEFNRKELELAGFRKTGVLPIIQDLSQYSWPPSPLITSLFADGKINVLFVGGLRPNKGLAALLRAFALFQKKNPKSRLLLVGEDRGVRHYTERLTEMGEALGVRDLVLSGHVDEDELVAYYSVADLFVCLSEHEGFCVPLLEAMLFEVPVVALDRGAVAETLLGAGVLLPEGEPALVASMMEEVLKDGALRRVILSSQARRVATLRSRDLSRELFESLAPVLPGHDQKV